MSVSGVPVIGEVVQPADLGSDDGNLFYCDQDCLVAEHEADRGRIPQAYAAIQKARAQAYKIVDDDKRSNGTDRIAIANDYVAAKEPAADANVAAVAATDQSLVSAAQATNADPTVARDAANDEADALAANNAKAQGQDGNAAYNNAVLDRTLGLPDGTSSSLDIGKLGSEGGVSGIAKLPETAIGKLPGAVSGAGAKIAADTLGPWKYVIVGLGLAALAVGGVYVYAYFKTAKTVAGAVA